MILIGADNQLAGQAGDHAAAAAAVAGGRGTTWAARVRPGVVAVDVDLSNESLAELVLEDVTGWCRRRGLWCVTRASGGGAGRHHLVVVPERHQGELLDLIEQWRLQLKVSRQALDVRSMIRPFAAPHRSGRAYGLPNLSASDLYRVQRAVRAAERHQPAVAACAPARTSLRIAPTERFGPFRLPQAPVAAGDGSPRLDRVHRRRVRPLDYRDEGPVVAAPGVGRRLTDPSRLRIVNCEICQSRHLPCLQDRIPVAITCVRYLLSEGSPNERPPHGDPPSYLRCGESRSPARLGQLMSPPVTIRVRYGDDDPSDDEAEAIYEIEDEVGECSRCGRRAALVLTVGLDRYCGDCSEQITESW